MDADTYPMENRIDHSEILNKFDTSTVLAEQKEIEDTYLSMRFAQKIR